ncbi:MAG: Na+/H+ antiporter subunit E [Planctomycetota bacterium]|jgi:multicomponent Na+:H+ antiporter subunit E
MKAFLVNLLLAGLWAAATGSWDLGNLVFGFVAAYLVLLWIWPFFERTAYFHVGPRAVGLGFYFFWELLISNVRVARDIVAPRDRRRSGFVAIPLDAKTDAEITLLSILVTLTPGEVTLDVSDDRKVMYIHAMYVEDPDAVRRMVKEGFERRVLDLLRGREES